MPEARDINAPPGPLAVMGQGHIGLQIALRAASVGWQVTGFDLDKDLVNSLNAGIHPFPEDDFSDLLAKSLESERYRATNLLSELEGFSVALLCVPGLSASGDRLHPAIRQCCEVLGPMISKGCLISVESTVPPGTTEGLVRKSLERASGLRAGKDFFLGVSPERINTGPNSLPFHQIPKLIAGVGDGSLMRMKDFYSTLVEEVIEVSGTLEAELAKLLENTFRQVNIALVNEVSKTSRALGANPWEVLRAASTKPFGFMAFRPGAGTGGHCVPSASEALASVARKAGARLSVVEAANMVNLSMPEYLLDRVRAALARQGLALAGSRIVVLGLAYKPGVSDTRNSSGVRMANLLSSYGAIVWVADPLVSTCPELDPKISVLSPEKSQQANCDLALVTCIHPGWEVKPLLSGCGQVLDATFSLEGQGISYP